MNISIFAPDFCRNVRKILLLFIGVFLVNLTSAQIHEIGLFLGGSNFVGDVGKETYISPDSPAFGLLYKWNKSTRHSWRFSAIKSTLEIDDLKASSVARQERGLELENTITEVSVGLEFNFFEFDMHSLDFQITPYVYTGLSYFWYDNMYILNGVAQKDEKRGGSLAIPMTLGMKFGITRSLILGIESSVKYTFVDDIDGSFPKNAKYESFKFGNFNSNDWFVFTGLTLTYTFGQNPCFCPL